MSETRKAALRAALETARGKTLWLLGAVPDDFLKVRVHDFYSPIGWHFGHIGMTEELWTLHKALHRPCLNDRLSFLFANLPENPKDGRVHLPAREEIVAYLAETRRRVFDALEGADLDSPDPLLADGYAWEFALQHECQHQETIAEMLQLIQKAAAAPPALTPGPSPNAGRGETEGETTSAPRLPEGDSSSPLPALGEGPGVRAAVPSDMIALPGGVFTMGSDDRHGYDNEKQAHAVEVAPFVLDRTPVTAAQWQAFLADGGYARPELWTIDGWAWRQKENADRPEYWFPDGDNDFGYFGPMGARAICPDEPVTSISWYEADAFARWAGKRLPTEAEWEFAAAYDPETGQTRRFPWGDAPPTDAHAAFGLSAWVPAPVGSRPNGASALGLLDMAGGVWEWTASPFLPYPGFDAFPYDGYSKEHMDGAHFVCRGGSWATAAPILRCAFRNWYVPTYRQGFLGLRCAQ